MKANKPWDDCITKYAACVTENMPPTAFPPMPVLPDAFRLKLCYRNSYIIKLDKTPYKRHNYSNIIIMKGVFMKEENKNKLEVLKRHGALNPHADKVRGTLFQEEEFFDPNDLMQTKYEMLRCVAKEGESVAEASLEFGFSRLSFYRIKSAFDKEGLVGIIPRQRGPKQAYTAQNAKLGR